MTLADEDIFSELLMLLLTLKFLGFVQLVGHLESYFWQKYSTLPWVRCAFCNVYPFLEMSSIFIITIIDIIIIMTLNQRVMWASWLLALRNVDRYQYTLDLTTFSPQFSLAPHNRTLICTKWGPDRRHSCTKRRH